MAESTSWASRETGKPVEQVMKADGKGQKKPTVTDARKLGLMPRTTSIFKDAMRNEALEYWKKLQLVGWMMKNPYRGGPVTEEATEAYFSEAMTGSMEATGGRAERGTEIHAEVGKWIDDLSLVDGVWDSRVSTDDVCAKGVIRSIHLFLMEVNAVKVVSEWNFVRPDLGYSGTADLYVEGADGTDFILDLKTTGIAKLTKPHLGWLVQLAAYHKALIGGDKPPVFVQIVFDMDSGEPWGFDKTPTGRPKNQEHIFWFNAGGSDDNPTNTPIPGFYLYTQEEVEEGAALFFHIFETWKLLKKYDPAKWVEGGGK